MPAVLPTPALLRRIADADAAYTRYNSRRSFADAPPALEERAFAGALAFRDASRRGFYYNRALGRPADLDALIAWYHGAGLPCGLYFTPDQLDDDARAAIRGFAFAGGEVFLARALGAPIAPPDPAIAIRRAGPDDLEVICALFAEGDAAAIPAALRAARGPAQFEPCFRLYLARLDGRVVAMASTFLHRGLAWFGSAHTLPAARGRGCHSALLRRRLADAAAAGCDLAITDTAFGSASHRNALRAGMGALMQSTWFTLAP